MRMPMKRAAWIAALLIAPVAVMASPIRIDFTVTATSGTNEIIFSMPSYAGYSAGTTGSGSFVFDGDIGNYSNSAGQPISDFSFDWLGTNWTQGDASLFRLHFDASGNLDGWGIGSPLGCGANCLYSTSSAPTDFWIDGYGPNSSQGSLAIQHNANVNGYMRGSVKWSATAVPEPGTLGLMALGLAGIVALGRRRPAPRAI